MVVCDIIDLILHTDNMCCLITWTRRISRSCDENYKFGTFSDNMNNGKEKKQRSSTNQNTIQ